MTVSRANVYFIQEVCVNVCELESVGGLVRICRCVIMSGITNQHVTRHLDISV